MLAAIERFVLWALCVTAIGCGLWFGVPALIRGVVGQHDQLVVTQAANAGLQTANQADTASASQGQLRCSTEARQAVSVGRAIGRIAAPRTVSTGARPMVTAADLRSIVEPKP